MFAATLRYLLRLRRTAGLALAGLAITAAVCVGYWVERRYGSTATPILKGEIVFRDLLAQKGRRSAPRADLAFLGYDEASLSLDGLWPDEVEASPALKALSDTQARWPWPRSVQAAILDRLAQAGAKAVIFDLVFVGPGADDDAFHTALERYKDQAVIGANFNFATRAITLPSKTLVPETSPPDNRVGYVDYVSDVASKAFALSYRATTGDLRRVATTDVYESLVARALRKAGHGDLIPTDSVNQLYAFRFSDDFHAKPVYEIFSDALWQGNYQSGAYFKDKIVLVGPTASVMHDVHLTPIGTIPGPALHLHALAAALNRDFLRLSTPREDIGLIAFAGLLAYLIGLKVRPPLPRTILLLLTGVGYVALLFFCYNRFGWQLAAFAPLLTFYTGGFGGLVGEYVIERAEKARVRGVLDRLVSKDIVRELLENRESYEELVRGVRRPVTVLFSDVRGFTTLSEAADDPRAFIAQLNEYLGEMVDVVFKHQGTLDKFIGDAVMAVWGSMHTDGVNSDACKAVAAALEMRVRLAALNEKWTREGKLPLDIGIGLNHGDAMVGGLGSEKSKMEITVIGDAVNLASRLESLTKEYGLGMLVGESVARIVSESYRLRTVDLVRVKGKKKPSEVMSVLGPLTDVPSEAQEYLLADYEDAILLYRKQEFAAAAQLLETCLVTDPRDRLCTLYLERCREFLAEAPAADWDGVKLMTTK